MPYKPEYPRHSRLSPDEAADDAKRAAYVADGMPSEESSTSSAKMAEIDLGNGVTVCYTAGSVLASQAANSAAAMTGVRLPPDARPYLILNGKPVKPRALVQPAKYLLGWASLISPNHTGVLPKPVASGLAGTREAPIRQVLDIDAVHRGEVQKEP